MGGSELLAIICSGPRPREPRTLFPTSVATPGSIYSLVDGLCSNALFQEETVMHGAVFLLLPLVFWLDSEQSASDPDYVYAPHNPSRVLDGELTELQRKDACAREACVGLRRLAGWDQSSSGCEQAQESLYALLGPMLAKLLENHRGLLKAGM